jgi:hypothetical protein
MSNKSHAIEILHRAIEAEQEGQGVTGRRERNTFVPPARQVEIRPLPNQEITLAVQHPARQEVRVETSAVDRAKGYNLVIIPLAAGLGVLAVIVAVALGNSFLTFASLLIFWVTFVLVWLLGWIVTALATPEAVSFYGAKRQWDVIEREQHERWEHYKWQTGRMIAPPPTVATAGRTLMDDIRLAMILGFAIGLPIAIAIVWLTWEAGQ